MVTRLDLKCSIQDPRSGPHLPAGITDTWGQGTQTLPCWCATRGAAGAAGLPELRGEPEKLSLWMRKQGCRHIPYSLSPGLAHLHLVLGPVETVSVLGWVISDFQDSGLPGRGISAAGSLIRGQAPPSFLSCPLKDLIGNRLTLPLLAAPQGLALVTFPNLSKSQASPEHNNYLRPWGFVLNIFFFSKQMKALAFVCYGGPCNIESVWLQPVLITIISQKGKRREQKFFFFFSRIIQPIT